MDQGPQQTNPSPDSDVQQGPSPAPAPARGGPAGLVLCLTILSILTAGVGGTGCLVTLASAAIGRDLTPQQALVALMYLLAGLSLGCGMWALSWIVRSQFEAAITQRRMPSPQAGSEPTRIVLPPVAAQPRPVASSPSPAQQRHDAELLATVRELSANLLLTPPEREAKRKWQQEHVAGQIVQDAQAAIACGDFAKAGQVLQRLDAEFPADPRTAELAEALNHARAAAVEDDIARAKTKAGDLMALAKFQDARDVAQSLVARYPQEPRAAALLESVAREGDAFYGEQRKRLYDELERHVNDRRWRGALAAARDFIEKFPDCREAKLVTVQMQTLEDNARLEEVRELRDRFRDCLDRKRYAEALRIARDVIDRFPATAAAGELQGQLPRLKELAEENRS